MNGRNNILLVSVLVVISLIVIATGWWLIGARNYSGEVEHLHDIPRVGEWIEDVFPDIEKYYHARIGTRYVHLVFWFPVTLEEIENTLNDIDIIELVSSQNIKPDRFWIWNAYADEIANITAIPPCSGDNGFAFRGLNGAASYIGKYCSDQQIFIGYIFGPWSDFVKR